MNGIFNFFAMEDYFKRFRENIVGVDSEFESPYGKKNIVYADWTASGRLYWPIEKKILELGKFLGNTHTETTLTGKTMTNVYNKSKEVIKNHVNASNEDVLISTGAGMTGAVNKFQRILGLKIHERFKSRIDLNEDERPVVFLTHMEHHSNQTSWLETIADIKIIQPDMNGKVDLNHFEELIKKNSHRKYKIASVTACSNVSGIKVPYHSIAKMIHKAGGYCFVDFACSAPYVNINMHPENDGEYLDAIYFSPHKFLGGPGSSGILIFNKKLYKNKIPDHPGGGTVDWTNPWGEHRYHDDIELREDGGTPAFLQTIKAGLSVRLKEEMGVENIEVREKEMVKIIWGRMSKIKKLHILAPKNNERLGVFSFYIEGLHYNLGVKLLNDRYGIQTRGGCSCAGTYGHYLLNIDEKKSHEITNKVNEGKLSYKPGWIRMSVHPTMTDKEINYILDALEELADNFEKWGKDYYYIESNNEFYHETNEKSLFEDFFNKL